MPIFELLKNPIVKIIGVIFVLYFALFQDRSHPDALGNRLSKEKITQETKEFNRKKDFILTNLSRAKQVPQPLEKITISDVKIGSGKEEVACGDQVQVDYIIYTENSRPLQIFSGQTLLIEKANGQAINDNIIGMREGGVRKVWVPAAKRLKGDVSYAADKGVKYEITLSKILQKSVLNCL